MGNYRKKIKMKQAAAVAFAGTVATVAYYKAGPSSNHYEIDELSRASF